ncbi:uncharacterized protein LOC143922409 [Arctopsyche grandis]|uniref:uncharacterized protein LOC143922409 n=1 Tax=Arctopsyche grandis TaxID=121162 RepID=UPI00406D78C0
MRAFQIIVSLLLLAIIQVECFNLRPTNATSVAERNQTHLSERYGRFFPLFTIIRFPNTECVGTGTTTGVCFTKRECNDLKGTVTGSCASKRGVCCIIQRTCGGTTNVNGTYFSNSGFPNSFNAGGRCALTVTRCNSDICQLRLEFLELSLAQPDGTGACLNDFMTVTGGSSQVPRICGENSGQHVYINFNGDSPITISISTNTGVDFNRRWNIKLVQLGCSCPTLAPSGCLMYYTGTSGTVRSFNYGTMQNAVVTAFGMQIIGTRELANLNYGICIRMEAGFCSIQWAQTADIFSFTVTGDVVGLGNLVGTPVAEVVGAACTTDFVVIANPVGFNADRFCGAGFSTKTTFSKPFVLTVVTNANEGPAPPDVANRGFMLTFAQQACAQV